MQQTLHYFMNLIKVKIDLINSFKDFQSNCNLKSKKKTSRRFFFEVRYKINIYLNRRYQKRLGQKKKNMRMK